MKGLDEKIQEMLDRDVAAMLGYTTFIDKKTILCKRRLIPSVGRSDIENVFDWMEGIRNACAHPDTYEEPFIAPEDLLEQITACERLLQAIEEQLLPPPPAES